MGLIDLVTFSQNLSRQFPNPQMQAALQSVDQAVGEAVVFNVRGDGKTGSHGLSIYLPHRRSETLEDSFAGYSELPLAQRHSWFPFIERATRLARVQKPGQVLDKLQTRLDDGVLELSSKVLDERQLDFAEFALAKQIGERTVVLGTSSIDPVSWNGIAPDEGTLTASWHGDWFTLKLGGQTMLCPEVYDDSLEDDEAWYVDVVVEMARKGSDKWKTVTLEFYFEDDDDDTGSLDYVSVRKKGEEREINLRAGDRIRPKQQIIDADGEYEWVPDEESVITLSNPDRLKLVQEPVRIADLQIGFVGYDVNGNLVRQFAKVGN